MTLLGSNFNPLVFVVYGFKKHWRYDYITGCRPKKPEQNQQDKTDDFKIFYLGCMD